MAAGNGNSDKPEGRRVRSCPHRKPGCWTVLFPPVTLGPLRGAGAPVFFELLARSATRGGSVLNGQSDKLSLALASNASSRARHA